MIQWLAHKDYWRNNVTCREMHWKILMHKLNKKNINCTKLKAMNFVKKGAIRDFCEIMHSKVPQPFNESSSMWFICFSLCVRSWQTEAFTDMGFSEACQSLTLLLGDRHDKNRCKFMNWLLHFISSMFSVSSSPPFNNLPSSCPLPAILLQLYIPLQMYSFDVFEGEQKIPFGMQVSV